MGGFTLRPEGDTTNPQALAEKPSANLAQIDRSVIVASIACVFEVKVPLVRSLWVAALAVISSLLNSRLDRVVVTENCAIPFGKSQQWL